jgi:hypothetical protein
MPLSTSSSYFNPLASICVLYAFPYGRFCPCANYERSLRPWPHCSLSPSSSRSLSLTLTSSRRGHGGVTLTLAAGDLELPPALSSLGHPYTPLPDEGVFDGGVTLTLAAGVLELATATYSTAARGRALLPSPTPALWSLRRA